MPVDNSQNNVPRFAFPEEARSQLRILLVEDNPSETDLIQASLKRGPLREAPVCPKRLRASAAAPSTW